MSETTTSGTALPVQGPAATGRSDRWFRRRMLALLEQLQGCEITIEEGATTLVVGRPAATGETLRCTVSVRDPAMFRLVALGGSVGVGEAYMDGLWDCTDVTTLVRIFVRNRELLDRMETGFARLGGALLRLFHRRNRNTRRGSRRNIAAHYDLGNELFELFLDDDLMYSCAVFEREDEPLEVASRRKLDRICRKLALAPGMRLVEIGTGWGGGIGGERMVPTPASGTWGRGHRCNRGPATRTESRPNRTRAGRRTSQPRRGSLGRLAAMSSEVRASSGEAPIRVPARLPGISPIGLRSCCVGSASA